MFEVEVLEKTLKEEVKEDIGSKLALMRNGIMLAIFDIDTYITDIECKAHEVARKTLRAENIDLVIIEKNNIKLLKKDIVKEKKENYQVINEHIYNLDEKEAKEELKIYAKNIFSDMLYRSDAYFEVSYNAQIYNNCIDIIFEQIMELYNEGYTIYTSNNSFLLRGTYKDVMSTDFADCKITLTKKTKKSIIKNVKNSGLSEAAKKEIIRRVKYRK